MSHVFLCSEVMFGQDA